MRGEKEEGNVWRLGGGRESKERERRYWMKKEGEREEEREWERGRE